LPSASGLIPLHQPFIRQLLQEHQQVTLATFRLNGILVQKGLQDLPHRFWLLDDFPNARAHLFERIIFL